MGKEEIESAIYGAYECFASTEPRIEYPARAPLKRPVPLFLEERGGRRIEFRITGENNKRMLAIRRVSGAAEGRGPVVSVREAVEAMASVSGEVLMRFCTAKS
jgi:hypothetical protein